VDVTTSGALDVDEKAVSEKLQRVRWTKEIMLGRTRYIDVIWE
jgi:hypothetical protein